MDGGPEQPCGRPSMIARLAAGETAWTSVDLVVCGTGHQGVAIRAGLEEMGVRVNLFPVGQARHLVNVLSGRGSAAPNLILDTHGDDGRIVLPALAPEIAAGQPFDGYLGPAELATFVHLPGRVVISLGCTTGAEPLARAFLTTEGSYKGLEVTVERDGGKPPLVAQWGGISLKRRKDATLDDQPKPVWNDRTEVVQRLLADERELCGSRSEVEGHHVRRLKDLQRHGRSPQPAWVQKMASRQRKTLAVCHECHVGIHAGRRRST